MKKAFLVLMLLLTTCVSKQAWELLQEDESISLGCNERLVLRLRAEPATGYIWSVPGTRPLQLVEETFESLDPSLVGGPCTQTLRFVGVEPGRSTLRLEYGRPWRRPERTVVLETYSEGAYSGTGGWTTVEEVTETEERVTSGGLPSAFSWCNATELDEWCDRVDDQNRCGSCWACAAAAEFEATVMLVTGEEVDLSEQFLLSCVHDMLGKDWGCNGGNWPQDIYVAPHPGSPLERDLPYQAKDWRDVPCPDDLMYPHQANWWAYVDTKFEPPPVAELKRAIAERGPVAVAVYVDRAFVEYEGGVFDAEWVPSETWPNHAVVLVGWDDAEGAWLLRNSWGDDWGEDGYMWIAYDTHHVGHAAAYTHIGDEPEPPPPEEYRTVVHLAPSELILHMNEMALVDVWVRDVESLGVYEVGLAWDPEIIGVWKVRQGTFLGSTGRGNGVCLAKVPTDTLLSNCGKCEGADGSLKLIAFTLGGGRGPDGDGTLVAFYLYPRQQGETSLDLGARVANTVFDEVEVEVHGGHVIVVPGEASPTPTGTLPGPTSIPPPATPAPTLVPGGREWSDARAAAESDFATVHSGSEQQVWAGGGYDLELEADWEDEDDGFSAPSILHPGGGYDLVFPVGGQGWATAAMWADWDGAGGNMPDLVRYWPLIRAGNSGIARLEVPGNFAGAAVIRLYVLPLGAGLGPTKYNENLLGGEVEDYIYGESLPTPESTRTPVASPTPTQIPISTVTPSPTGTDTPVPVDTPTGVPTGVPTGTPTSTPTPEPTWTPWPTPAGVVLLAGEHVEVRCEPTVSTPVASRVAVLLPVTRVLLCGVLIGWSLSELLRRKANR